VGAWTTGPQARPSFRGVGGAGGGASSPCRCPRRALDSQPLAAFRISKPPRSRPAASPASEGRGSRLCQFSQTATRWVRGDREAGPHGLGGRAGWGVVEGCDFIAGARGGWCGRGSGSPVVNRGGCVWMVSGRRTPAAIHAAGHGRCGVVGLARPGTPHPCCRWGGRGSLPSGTDAGSSEVPGSAGSSELAQPQFLCGAAWGARPQGGGRGPMQRRAPPDSSWITPQPTTVNDQWGFVASGHCPARLPFPPRPGTATRDAGGPQAGDRRRPAGERNGPPAPCRGGGGGPSGGRPKARGERAGGNDRDGRERRRRSRRSASLLPLLPCVGGVRVGAVPAPCIAAAPLVCVPCPPGLRPSPPCVGVGRMIGPFECVVCN